MAIGFDGFLDSWRFLQDKLSRRGYDARFLDTCFCEFSDRSSANETEQPALPMLPILPFKIRYSSFSKSLSLRSALEPILGELEQSHT